MVEFVAEPERTSVVQDTTSIFSQLYNFFVEWWQLLLASIVVLIVGIIAYYVFVKREEEAKERDEPGYALFKNVKQSAKLNADKKKIIKRYSFFNLLWFGLPLKWNEHSAKILNMTNELMGYYRGDFISMDSTLNILLYKKKYWVFFEDDYILKIPLEIKMNIPDGNKKDDKGKIKTKQQIINLRDQIARLPNHDMKINCVNLERVGQYYYVPVFPIRENKGVLDVRKLVEGAVIDSTNQQMIQRLLNTGAKQMEVMAKFNPYLKYEQSAPEKTQEEKKVDDNA